ncbi:hypothetical protein [Leifsonia sp. Leaf264]|uniref:hypothetical protein n=1 Tax=Leifsonia sp. Leaf264 TaxID=1736314 RepID=UPI0006F851B2|nr:hypothetical protein [Leifsonia sp. Leaf264]KQO98773.1 hypothetical protein ASF30_11975 [Leifsonia sp. Leaf264]
MTTERDGAATSREDAIKIHLQGALRGDVYDECGTLLITVTPASPTSEPAATKKGVKDYGLGIDELPEHDINVHARSWSELTDTQKFLYSLIEDTQSA